MPRPTAAQFAYGSATVVSSTVALLLLTRTDNGIALAAICAFALVLGLAVTVAQPARRGSRGAAGLRTAEAAGLVTASTAPPAPAVAAAAADGLTTRVPAPRAAGARVEEHSLRG